MDKHFDFGGYATKYNIKCADGKTIAPNTFDDMDGQTVPLVWNHDHVNADNVLGHAVLEKREDGIYAHCSFNDTKQGQNAKSLVQHGDVIALSIYANNLHQKNNVVTHGVIREVSLCLAGANSEAKIDTIEPLQHSLINVEEQDPEMEYVYEGTIYGPKSLELEHSVSYEEADQDDQTEDSSNSEDEITHADEKEITVEEAFDALDDQTKELCYILMSASYDKGKSDAQKETENKEENNKENEEDMKHNLFENKTEENKVNEMFHSAFADAVNAAQKNKTSVKEMFADKVNANEELAHSITNIENFFPEATLATKEPELVTRTMSWVDVVLGNVHKVPFARIKSTYANLTADEARAKGFIKGKEKTEQVFAALKRTTDPYTIYKKQAIDRDDTIDITDFDIVSLIKKEMKMMLNEELARAILIGDGRPADSDDKIAEDHIRPVWKDNDTYTIKKGFTREAGATDTKAAEQLIDLIIKSRKEYKGSGNPSLYIGADALCDMLLIKDTTGRRIYNTIDELKTALRVSSIVECEIMDGQNRATETTNYALKAILVNLNDYYLGNNKNGDTTTFEDFDIDYNKQKYLIETRKSGALIRPYSAIAFEEMTTITTQEVQG